MALAFSRLFPRALTIVRGGGNLASGVIYRLHRAGLPVIVTELEQPLLVRRTVSYGEAIYAGEITIEGITARHVTNTADAQAALANGMIPVLADPKGAVITTLKPAVVIDGRMAKANIDTLIDDAPLVVTLGPGFESGVDCHAVIETSHGHNLGRVVWQGKSEPGNLADEGILYAPKAGIVIGRAAIGDSLQTGALIAEVGTEKLLAPFDGILRGLLHEQVQVSAGMKVGDLDPRAQRENCFTISDKALAIGGGALEAIFSALQLRPYLKTI